MLFDMDLGHLDLAVISSTPSGHSAGVTRSAHPASARHRHGVGLAGVAAGTLLTVSQVVGLALDRDPAHLAEVATSGPGSVYVLTKLGAYLLLPLVVLGVHVVQSHRSGRLAAIGLVLAWTGTLLTLGDWWFEAFAVPWLAVTTPDALSVPPGPVMVVAALAGFLLQAMGWVLLGIASLRAAVLPRSTAVLMVVGGAVSLGAGYPPFLLPLAVAVVAVGLALLRHRPAAAAA